MGRLRPGHQAAGRGGLAAADDQQAARLSGDPGAAADTAEADGAGWAEPGPDSAEFIPAQPAAQPAGVRPRPAAGRTARRGPDPWRTAFFAVLILAILGGAAWALLGSSLLVVRHEQVAGNRKVLTARVLAAAGIRRGTPLESVNTAAAARRIERIPQVLSATVSRSWPDSIVIVITERTPELAVASAGRFALVDAHGVLFQWARHRPAGIPLLIPLPGQPGGSQGVRAAVAVLRQLPRSLRRLVESVSAPAANAVTFGLRGGITVVWGGAAGTRAKAAALIVLLKTHARYYDVSDPLTAVTQR